MLWNDGLRGKGSADERYMACERGRLAHAHAEYLLKTGAKLARHNANKRGIWRTGQDELDRCPISHAMGIIKSSRNRTSC